MNYIIMLVHGVDLQESINGGKLGGKYLAALKEGVERLLSRLSNNSLVTVQTEFNGCLLQLGNSPYVLLMRRLEGEGPEIIDTSLYGMGMLHHANPSFCGCSCLTENQGSHVI